jgi:hypothetical protein
MEDSAAVLTVPETASVQATLAFQPVTQLTKPATLGSPPKT